MLVGLHVLLAPVGVLVRKGNTGSNTAAAHVTVLRQALRQRLSRLGGEGPGCGPSRSGYCRGMDSRAARLSGR